MPKFLGRRRIMRGFTLILLAGVPSSLLGQVPSLGLSSSSADPSGVVTLNLNLSIPSGATPPATLQWALFYPSTDVVSVSISPASSLSASGKSLSCSVGNGLANCVATGLNGATIPAGQIAGLAVTLGSSTSSLSIPVSVVNPVGASIDGTGMGLAGIGGLISINSSSSQSTAPASITSLSPSSATAGGAAFTLTVNGSNFGGSSVVNWNGSPRATTVVSTTQLRAAISAADVAAAGTAQISVSNPSVGTSANSTFPINPLPAITSLSPSSATAGAAAFTLTVNGANFTANSVVNWNGAARATTFVSATQVKASILVTDVAAAATVPVTVTAGNGTSASSSFVVNPTINPALPTVLSQSCAALKCTVTLSKAAPSGGASVALSSNTTNLTVPASIMVAASSTSASFTATSIPVATNQTATVTASYNGTAKTASIALTAPVLSTFTCSPTSIAPGASSTCTVAISSIAATGGLAVSLSTPAAGVTIPASVTVAAKTTSVQFAATTTSSTPAQTAVISATAGSVTKSASIAIPAPVGSGTISTLTCSPTTFVAGTPSSCTVSLSTPAPTNGARIYFSTPAAGVTVASPITIAAGASTGKFTVTTTGSTPGQTAVITAIGSNTKTISLVITANIQITNFSCIPTTVIPGGSATCTVNLSAAAPSGGWVATVSDTSSQLSVPATVNVLATNNLYQFQVSADLNASILEPVTLTTSVQSATKTTSVTVNPNPLFYFQGTTAEITSNLNGATVVANTAPGNWPGVLTLRGSGKLMFDPVQGSSGVSFHDTGGQNANTAFVNFSGIQTGQVFNTQGAFNLLLKSAYSFAARQALPSSPNVRYVFSVYDDTRPQFGFYTYTSGGKLILAFTTRGITSSYYVPAGQEDTLFGAGVVLRIRVAWTASSATLYLNGQAVTTSSFTGISPNWTAQSAFTIGSQNIKSSGGGYYASDDAVAELQIR